MTEIEDKDLELSEFYKNGATNEEIEDKFGIEAKKVSSTLSKLRKKYGIEYFPYKKDIKKKEDSPNNIEAGYEAAQNITIEDDDEITSSNHNVEIGRQAVNEPYWRSKVIEDENEEVDSSFEVIEDEAKDEEIEEKTPITKEDIEKADELWKDYVRVKEIAELFGQDFTFMRDEIILKYRKSSGGKMFPARPPFITSKIMEANKLWRDGKTAEQIAKIVGWPMDRVNQKIQNLRDKTNGKLFRLN